MIQVNCDGGIRGGNPGGTPSWAWVRRQEGQKLRFGSGLVPEGRPATSNVAEYYAVLYALHALLDEGLVDEEVELRSDSQLIVNQILGNFAVSQPALQILHRAVKDMLQWFDRGIQFIWVPRTQNVEADSLAADAFYKSGKRRPAKERDIVK